MSEMGADVGQVFIEAHADTSGLSQELRTAAAAAAEMSKIELDVDLNEKDLEAKVKAAADLASHVAEVEYTAKLNSARLKAEAAALAKAASEDIEFRATFDKSTLARLRGQAGAFTRIGNKAQDLVVNIRGDARPFEATLNKLRGDLAILGDIELDLQPKIDFAALSAEIKAIGPTLPDLPLGVSIQAAEVEAKLAAVARDRALQLRISGTGLAAVNASVDALRARLEAHPIKIPIEPDIQQSKFIRDLIFRLRSVKKIPLPLSSELDSNFFARLRNQLASRPVILPIEFELSDRSNRSLIQRFRDIWAGFRNAGEDVGSSISGIFGKTTGLFGKMRVVVGFLAAQVLLVVIAVTALIPLLEAVATVLAGVVLEVGAAALALGAFAAVGIASLAAGIGTVLIGVQGLGTAFTALGKILTKQNQGIKVSKQDWKEYQQTLRALSPAAAHFVATIQELAPSFRKLQLAVQNQLFKGLSNAIQQTARTDLPFLQKGFVGIAAVINKAALAFLAWARSDTGQQELSKALGIIQENLGKILLSAGHLAHGLFTLFLGSEENARHFSDALLAISETFDKWATKVTTTGKGGKSPLETFFESAWRAAHNLWLIIMDLISIAGTFLSAWFPATSGDKKDPLTRLRENLDKLDKWLKAHPDALKNFIGESLTKFDQLLSDVKNIAIQLQRIADDIDIVIEGFKKLTGSTIIGVTVLPGLVLLDATLNALINTFEILTGQKPFDWRELFPPAPGMDTIIKFILGDQDLPINKWWHDHVVVPWNTALGNFWTGVRAAFNANTLGELLGIIFGLSGPVDIQKWLFDNILVPIIDFFTQLPGFIQKVIKALQHGPGGGWVFQLFPPTTPEDCQRVFGPIFECIPALVQQAVEQAGQAARQIPPQFAPVVPGLQQWRGPIDDTMRSWFVNGPGYARTAANGIVSAFGGIAGRIAAAAGNVAGRIRSFFAGVVSAAKAAASGIVSAFAGLGARIVRAIGPITIKPHIDTSAIDNLNKTPALDTFTPDTSTNALTASSIRALVTSMSRALPTASQPANGTPAGGLTFPDAVFQKGTDSGNNAPITVNVTVPTDDPQAAAMAVLNRITAATAN